MINLDRGVTKRHHPAGVAVCMYKDDPGVYLDTSGNPISEQLAAEAGFPVEVYAKERQRKDRLAAAFKEINEEFGNIEPGAVVLKVGGYSVKHRGGGQFDVHDEDGNQMTNAPLNKDVAVKLARKMAANEKDGDGAEKPNPGKKES